MHIDNLFNNGDFVQVKTDAEKKKRQVTAIVIKGKSTLEYQVVCGLDTSEHAECELEKFNEQEIRKPGF